MTAAAVRKFRGCDYMPFKLKGVLLQHGISQPALAKAVLQKNGVPLSVTSVSFIVNGGYFPKSTPVADVKRQVEEFLGEKGATAAEIATIWEQDDSEGLTFAHPIGAHLSASTKAAEKRAARLAEVRETIIEPVETTMLSPAAKRHFKMFRDPFQDDVTGPEDVFLSGEQRYISEAMFQVAKHGGFLAVPGESGSGKSTLRKLLLDRIKGQPIRVIFPQAIDKERLTIEHMCRAIINDLAPGETIKASREAQARQVKDVLVRSAGADNSHVLVIEEAHDLSIPTLKSLKRFYELEDGFKKLLGIVLIGQTELKDKLDEHRYPDAREVIRRCELAELMPLGEDLEKYLALKFKRVGIELPAIFADDAYTGIRTRLTKSKPGRREVYSQLYPLVVNNLVTKAMNRAAELGMPVINGDLFKEL
ncbi:MAG: AAA family ATPase [Rhodocyclaceae bacterium]|nr:AAA family ATPase [Rhodocyclaceae bacterium]